MDARSLVAFRGLADRGGRQAQEEQPQVHSSQPRQWTPAHRPHADLGFVTHPPETATGKHMRAQLKEVTQVPQQATGSAAAAAAAPLANPHVRTQDRPSGPRHQVTNLPSLAGMQQRERMWEVNARQRDVLPNGVPSNYKPFVPPSRDAFRSVVNERGKLPNRYRFSTDAIGRESARPSRLSSCRVLCSCRSVLNLSLFRVPSPPLVSLTLDTAGTASRLNALKGCTSIGQYMKEYTGNDTERKTCRCDCLACHA